MDHGLQLRRRALRYVHWQFLGLVSYVGENNRLPTDRQILQKIVAGLIGNGADVGAFDLYIDVGQMLSRLLIQHVSDQVRVILILCP